MSDHRPGESGPEGFSRRLRRTLAERNWHHSDFAKVMGVHPTTLSRWVNGKQIPEDKTVSDLADTLDVSVSWLRYGADDAMGMMHEWRREDEEKVRDAGLELPRRLSLMALDFEREAIESGADRNFLRWIRGAMRDPELVAMFEGGYDERPMSAEEQEAEMEALIAGLRAILKQRMKRHKAAERERR